MKKLFASALILALTYAPTATFAAVNCDADSDGYIVIPNATMQLIDENLPYNEDGNYDPLQWESFYNIFTSAQEGGALTENEECQNLNFKKGAEPARCDASVVSPESGVYDSDRVNSLAGSRVNPAAFDAPNDGIDQDCDGGDGEFTPPVTGSTSDLGGLVSRSLNLLARAVVVISVAVLIWGGILYATAAGDEQKTAKARKAIIGAIIGLIVGLLAPAIVNFVSSQLA